MISALILGLALQTASPTTESAADYFPVKPGTVRTYEQKGGAGQLVNVVGSPLDMGGVTVAQITERQGGRPGITTYYRVDSDQVCIVAYDPKHPLPVPMPVLKLNDGKASWDFVGKTKTGPEGERMLAHGDARSAGKREVLGRKVDVIEVKILAHIGVGLSGMAYEQKAVYAKGIGLVELTTKMTLGKSKHPELVTYQLVSIEEAKTSG